MENTPFISRRDGYLFSIRAVENDSAELLAAVNRFTLRPLTLDEIAIFTLDLCNNQVDRHFSRFPEEELETINRLIVGRPLMERHDLRGSLPRGTFFRSRVHHEDGRVSVRPDVYVLRTAENEDFIRNIEGGVYRETSIGFAFRTPECSVCGQHISTCGHVPGREYAGATCHFLMREVVDVLEGSVVSCGSQGTQFVSQARTEELRVPTFPMHRTAWAAE